MAPVSATIINAIQNTTPDFRAKFSGAMPFVYFTAHGKKGEPGHIDTIGTRDTYTYNPQLTERFPPLITNLEVKPTGTMGVVREGSVTVKFASMNQLNKYQDFFRVGTAKTITWGWNQNRLNGADFPIANPTTATSKQVVNNINNWRAKLNDWNYSADILVGPLINFNFTLNNDASVDVVFTVGSPNELVAFMGSHKQTSTKVKSSDAENIASYRVSSLLNLVESNFAAGDIFDSEIRPGLLNYNTSQSTLEKMWNFVASLGNLLIGNSQYENVTDEIYMAFYLIEKYAINQNPTGVQANYIFDIDEAVAVAHPSIISNSENVIFLNKTAANPVVANKEITLDVATPQIFDTTPKSHSYPEAAEFKQNFGGAENIIPAGKWGYVKNIFFKVSFVQDIIKNNGDGSIVDIVEKLCNEINIASCGLTDLAPQVSSKKDGTEVFTVVDYALVPDKVAAIQQLNLFESGNRDSTIIDVSFNCDLPKEIGSMAMLGNRKATEVGGKLFFEYVKDTVLDAPGPSDYQGGATPPPPPPPPPGFAYVKIRGGSYKPGDKDTYGRIVPNLPVPPTIPPGKVWAYIYGSLDLRPQNQSQGAGWKVQDDPNLTPRGRASAALAAKAVIDESCIFIKYDSTEQTDSPNTFKPQAVFKAVFKNTDVLKSFYFDSPNHNKKNPLLPIELEITVLGISGIIAGQVVYLTPGNLPFDNNGLFQVKEVNHTVSDTWETTIKLGFRPEN
jgi:hypothetical protein